MSAKEGRLRFKAMFEFNGNYSPCTVNVEFICTKKNNKKKNQNFLDCLFCKHMLICQSSAYRYILGKYAGLC